MTNFEIERKLSSLNTDLRKKQQDFVYNQFQQSELDSKLMIKNYISILDNKTAMKSIDWNEK